MKINCISCGHNIDLDAVYEDFSGLVKCYVCGALLEIVTSEGHLRSVGLPSMRPPTTQSAGAGSGSGQNLAPAFDV